MTAGTIIKSTNDTRLVRDRLAWLGYLLYGYWSFVWGLFGPVMPSLRADLKLSYSVAALHFSALALGPLMAGFIGYHVIRFAGPPRVVWIGTLMIAAGVLCVIMGPNEICTIFGAWLVGFGGSHAGQAVIASLADRFKLHRGKVIAEINVSSSVFCSLAPLLVAAVIRLGLPWKTSLVASFLVLAVICLATKFGGGHVWHIDELKTTDNSRLPGSYWLYFTIVCVSVAAEWSVCFWCPEFLEKVHHFSRADACTGLSAFLMAMLVGRLFCGRLSTLLPTDRLLTLTTLFATFGFLMFWLGGNPIITLVGLAILGLGESTIYPLALTSAINISNGRTAKATSTMSLSTGSAIFFAPLILGVVADRIGILNAYGIVLFLVVIAAATSMWADLVLGRKRQIGLES